MKIQNTQTNYHTSFGKFIKTSGKREEIAKAKDMLWTVEEPHISLSQKGLKNDVLYIISGKEYDKFIDLTKEVYFRDLRTDLEKFMPFKPKTKKISSVLKKLKENKFKL